MIPTDQPIALATTVLAPPVAEEPSSGLKFPLRRLSLEENDKNGPVIYRSFHNTF